MMKPGKTVIIVDSVEDAVKFYTDRLGFDITELSTVEGGAALGYAEVKKGKCHILFRVPHPDEVIEFSQVKYAAMRGTGVFIELKKGIGKYFNRCKSKGVTIVEPLKKTSWGFEAFTIKDPFGVRLMFGQPLENYTPSFESFCGIRLDLTKEAPMIVDMMIRKLRSFGLSQRASKKFAKAHLKVIKR